MVRGYHKYKVVWYNPLLREDLLSKHEVGNLTTCMLYSLTWSDRFFLVFVWGQGNSHPSTKEKGNWVYRM